MALEAVAWGRSYMAQVKRRVRLGALALLALGLSEGGCSSAAASTYRLCIGEFEEKCPFPHEAFAGCYANPDTEADRICTVSAGGQQTAVPHRIIHEGQRSGNRCGYELYIIECMDRAN